MPYGTLSVSDLLATQKTVIEIGLDTVYQSIEVALAAHNAQYREELQMFCDITTDRDRRYGAGSQGTMDKVDEFGTADVQKLSAGSRVEFPLYKNQYNIQWTRDFMENAEARELAIQYTGGEDAHYRALTRDIKQALFYPTNKTVVDKLKDYQTLNVKALVNADGADIPTSYDGTTFNSSTHTHYLYTAGTSLAAADATALGNTVIEHSNVGKLCFIISNTNQAAMQALTGFIPVTPTFVTPATTSASIQQPFDILNPNNRIIGYYGNNFAEVWVKPWAIPGYVLAVMQGAPKPLCLRERRTGSADLNIVADNELHPLRANSMESVFGVGVWNRTAAAVLYIDSGAAGAYVAPNIVQ